MDRTTLTSAAVIARGAELADAHGFDAITLTAIARSFGVQAPSLYGHVRDLAALRDGVIALALGELADRTGDAVAGRAGRDALLSFAAVHRRYLQEHPGRWEALQRRAGPGAVQAPAARRVVRVTDAVLLGYGIPEEDRTHATRILGGALSGFLNLERVGSFAHSAPDAERSWRELLTSLHFLLAHWNERGAPPREGPP